MDKGLFLKMFRFAERRKWLQNFFVFATKASVSFFMVVYLAGGAILLFKNRGVFLEYLIVPLLVLVLSKALRLLIKRKRPSTQLKIDIPVKHSESYCFPSNHSASSMIIALSWVLISPVISAILMCMSLLTGVSRIFSGLHFPLDVLGGWSLALIIYYTGLLVR